jgi:hypothetical protein
MSIINSGIFDSETAYQRLVGGDWPTPGAISAVIVSNSTTIISTGNTSYNIGSTVTDPTRILVSVEGLLQIPSTDYSISGSNLTFYGAPAAGANIEIKFFGSESVNAYATLASKVDTFTGNGTVSAYTLSITPPGKDYITVVLNGNTLPSTSYTLVNRTLVLPSPLALNSNIDVRIIGGRLGASFNTRSFTGTGSSNTFPLSTGFTKDNILVFENGVAQLPSTDYDVVNDNLVFVTPPAANIGIQVRELGMIPANEGVTTLYYTNSRVLSAVTPLLTTANVAETTNLYFTNARVAPALTHDDVTKLMISPFMLMGA